MFLTHDYVKQLSPCAAGYRYFTAKFPEGGTYKDILDKCYEDGYRDWAEWLMDKVGYTETTAVSSMQTKVGVRFGIPGFVKATFDFLWNRTWFDPATVKSTEGDSQSDSAQLASSGHSARLASSGDSAQLASSGDSARLASSGHSAQLASSGDSAQLASSGDSARLASSGDSAQLASSGDSAQLASSGDSAQLASSGDSAQLASSGHSAQLASSGHSAQLVLEGDHSVGAAIGTGDNRIRGKVGCWITLAEWTYDHNLSRYVPVCVKTAQIDGDTLKADTWYKLQNGEFVEVE